MIDPRSGIQLVEDAYALAGGAAYDSVARFDDLILGRDWFGSEHVFGVLRSEDVGIRGTDNPIDAVMDAAVLPVATEFGLIASGVWSIYRSFRTLSGHPMAAFLGCNVHGHSLGAGLAAILSVAMQGEHVLWACPNWFGQEFNERFGRQTGAVFAMAGDPIPLMPLPTIANPRLGPITHLLPPAGLGWEPAAHHAFSTYIASYEAQFPILKAA